ncbi:PLP-dependent transferase [Trichoderma longibrachiatum ATCC 18648]|uniref:PLP-dependent transferase n=1 Tax=Trichoderma longibrachiatum ATCC 18648 TaxID=983965 RepID=A0A2T4C193_TRILO|nr:PLP-dependent transferase [Trichoderma longibrachiatum ATCC 18648]
MLSRRATEKNAWFLEQFKRPLARQGSKDASNIDMATAENWLLRPEVLSMLKRNCVAGLREEHLSYASGLGGTSELLESLSRFFNHFFSPSVPVRPEHIVTGTGCSAVLDTLINDICDEGDGLLVTAPMWGDFQVSAVLRNSVQLIPVYVSPEQSHSAGDIVQAYRDAAAKATCNVRGILFCNPHNPYGHICPTEAIDGLLQYCEEENLHFVSDEIYALSTFGDLEGSSEGNKDVYRSPETRFVSVLSRDLRLLGVEQARVHVLYSISKDFGCSGMRLGCLVSQDNKPLRTSQAILNNAKICNAGTIMVTPMFSDTAGLERLVNLNTQRLRTAAQMAIRFAEFHGLSYYKPVAGLYVWLRLSDDCSTFDEEEALVQRCSQRGVFVGSGADYSEPQPGWFRLTFALPEEKLLEGLRRIEEAMGYEKVFTTREQDFHVRLTNWWRGMGL